LQKALEEVGKYVIKQGYAAHFSKHSACETCAKKEYEQIARLVEQKLEALVAAVTTQSAA
jgi:hypothetical protein